jgi:electron-transferring-flavoprotein dehydrogenase
MSNTTIIPQRFQPDLPMDRLIIRETPDDEAVPMDVLFVGAGPAGLAGAIELSRLVAEDDQLSGLEIGVLEKSASIGEHCLSGAVIDASPLRELFPDVELDDLPLRGKVSAEKVYMLTERGQVRLPTPPPMKNHGNFVASICEVVRWMGERAEAAGVNVFTGFPADSLLMEGGKVLGVRTTPSEEMPATDVSARVTVLTEGCRGPLSQAWMTDQKVASPNPQIYALGVKELWQVDNPPDGIVHTLGYPLPRDAFGGSWMYPMGDGLVSLGLVVGLDYRQTTFDVHDQLQRMKLHPLFRKILEGGEMVEWGARTIPEGGYYSLPDRLSGDGLIIAGDAAGLVDVASLKGIHYAMYSGMYAARTIFKSLKADRADAESLAEYDQSIRDSVIARDLFRRRNMRLSFKSGFFFGGLKSSLAIITGGRVPGSRISVESDADEPKTPVPSEPVSPDGSLTFSKVDAVFRSGNATRDDIPSHLIASEDVPREVGEMYEHLCPAGVYEWSEDGLVINAPNCIDCRATDVLGPRWSPREGGSGPSYKRM